jgi:hypothetical protein
VLTLTRDVLLSQTVTTGNVSEAEEMVASVSSSSAFVQRLQAGGLSVAHVLLISCEPLDPAALPLRLRPSLFNVSQPVGGISARHSPCPLPWPASV